MFDWVTLATVLMKVVNAIIGIIDKEKMLKAGEARNVVKGMEALGVELEKGHKAISALRTDPEWLKRVQQLGDRD